MQAPLEPEHSHNRCIEDSELEMMDWFSFVELAKDDARTEPAKVQILNLGDPSFWAPNMEYARLLQKESREMLPLLEKTALWDPLRDLPDIFDSLGHMEKGGVLSPEELKGLQDWLIAIESWVHLPLDEVSEAEEFKKSLSRLDDPSDSLQTISKVLTPEGELSEQASPALRSLRSQQVSLKREIESTLGQLMSSYASQGLLQEEFSDYRDGRYVLPVKISRQKEIDGFVYEASVSHQSVFMEPKIVADLNNQLRRVQNEILAEVERILRDVVKRLTPYIEEYRTGLRVLIYWDIAQARARFTRRYSGKPIQVVSDRIFELNQTANPLLWWTLDPKTIVRNDLTFGPQEKTFLITGPNTGGKTVLLKTLGLASFCARTGFGFPASTESKVPFFDQYFVDLGDTQSLEQSVSSFSGHVLRYRAIFEKITNKSLVLLDELSSATDPREGAALSRAVLESLMKSGAIVVGTTHDPYLKALSRTHPEMVCASMTFESETRSPTYELRIGIPGQSRGIEIAERLGMPKEIIDRAREYLSEEALEFEQMISELEVELKKNRVQNAQIEKALQEAEESKRRWIEKNQNAFDELWGRLKKKLSASLEQAQDDIRKTTLKLRQAKKSHESIAVTEELKKVADAAEEQVRALVSEESPEISDYVKSRNQKNETHVVNSSVVQVGDYVRVAKWKSIGQVIEVLKDQVKVSLGAMQIQVPLSEVEIQESKKPRKTRFSSSSLPAETSHVDASIDVRGMTLEDARIQVELYLDLVFRSGSYSEVFVIHGLGTGVLREGLRAHFKKISYIKSFRDGGPGHGGTGATRVELDL